MIELMMVVAVIAIIAVIAYPSYQQYGYKSRRADAKALLLNAAIQQEKWRTSNSTYTNDPANIGGAVSPDGYYTLTVPVATGTTYVLRAAPSGGSVQNNDSACPFFTLNQDGQHAGNDNTLGTADDDKANCW